MKKTAIILSMILTPFISTELLFDKYEEVSEKFELEGTNLAKKLADFETNDPDSESFMNQAKNLKNLSVYTTSSLDITKSMEKDIAKYIKSSDLEELMRIKDGDSSIKFFILEGSDDNHVKELLMFVKGLTDMSQNQNFSINGKQLEIETVLLSLKGDIDLREVSKLTTKLNVPGGELLKKATKE